MYGHKNTYLCSRAQEQFVSKIGEIQAHHGHHKNDDIDDGQHYQAQAQAPLLELDRKSGSCVKKMLRLLYKK